MSNSSLESILIKLIDGPMVLSFPSPAEREKFRIGIYKIKRLVDDVFYMSDPEFESQVLKFDKRPLTEFGGPVCTAQLSLVDKNQYQAAQGGNYIFEILEETKQPHNGTETGSK